MNVQFEKKARIFCSTTLLLGNNYDIKRLSPISEMCMGNELPCIKPAQVEKNNSTKIDKKPFSRHLQKK